MISIFLSQRKRLFISFGFVVRFDLKRRNVCTLNGQQQPGKRCKSLNDFDHQTLFLYYFFSLSFSHKHMTHSNPQLQFDYTDDSITLWENQRKSKKNEEHPITHTRIVRMSLQKKKTEFKRVDYCLTICPTFSGVVFMPVANLLLNHAKSNPPLLYGTTSSSVHADGSTLAAATIAAAMRYRRQQTMSLVGWIISAMYSQ